VKFGLVEQMVREQIAVKLCCHVLELSRSGYYSWKARVESERKKRNDELTAQVLAIHRESRGTYGLPRIMSSLKDLGKGCGKSRLSNIMKIAQISGLIKKKFKIKTTDSNHDGPIAPRVFQIEEPHTYPIRPNQVWASDITYIPTREGFVFLGTYADLFTRKVVGFDIQDHMRTELLLTALEMALGRQHLTAGELMAHSDRGSQYASETYRAKMKELGITLSMSRKGNCYDNAYAESFFATLKKELVYRTEFKTKDEAKKAIFEFIEVWYNRKRKHSSIGFMTPVQFEESLAA
jgi:transposase InsO family protein